MTHANTTPATTEELIDFVESIQDRPVTHADYIGNQEPKDSIYAIAEDGDIWIFGDDHERDKGKRIVEALQKEYPGSEIFDNLDDD